MSFNIYIKQLEERTKVIIPKCKGDYIKNDLLHCGKCHTPKQGSYSLNGIVVKPYILCKCENEQRQKEEEKAREKAKAERIEKLRLSGIQDSKLLSYSFDVDLDADSRNSKAFRRYCNKWREMKAKNIGLILFGDCGTGKSFYSGCIANEIIRRYENSVIVTSIPRILNQLFSIEDKNRYIKNLAETSLLVIDDLGAERSTDYALEQVYAVIDERYKAEKPLIITTNLTYQELESPTDIRYKRIYDRVLEMCVPIELDGVSRRVQKAEEKKKAIKSLFE